MSLIKQLWIAIVIVTLLALVGSLGVSTWTARYYLQEQLNDANTNIAKAIALSVSQLDKDRGTIETQINSQGALGLYRTLRVTDLEGKVIAEYNSDDSPQGVPAWFVNLAAIKALPGEGSISNGWQPFGTLFVESQTSYANKALWNSLLWFLLLFTAVAAIAGLVGWGLLGRITQPLRTLVAHAQAIGERRFITTPEPRSAELKVVVRAMNALSERVRQMLADEAQRLETLRRQVQEDAVTGLLERRQFLNAFSAQLDNPDAPAQGTLLILRVCGLNELNRDLGRTTTDRLLQTLAGAFRDNANRVCGRLNGSDLAVFAPPVAELGQWAVQVAERVHAIADQHPNANLLSLPMAAVSYSRADVLASILARLDTALAEAELEGARSLKIEARDEAAPPARNQELWREILTTALAGAGLQLGSVPVRTLRNELIHNEAPVNLSAGDILFKTGDFLPWATRLGLVGRLDLAVVRLALERIRAGGDPVAVAISASALQDGRFIAELIALLRASPEMSARLWLEVPEEGAVRNPAAFHAFCIAVDPFFIKLGIKHAGPRFSALGDLHDLGLDYLKVDASLLRDIDSNKGNQSFVRSLVMLAHALGFTTIAEGIDRPEQQAILADLGFDGFTGPLTS
ncbi:MAG: EAL domain-containing protein [Azoarcus sp.]|jgi:EAL domain-containing protein (putative c-di-GMP-specific phosphodiesterase class I)/GGDEF domain-containing protein|nr:EAL domain-containing protein [Azoarcus sp.]